MKRTFIVSKLGVYNQTKPLLFSARLISFDSKLTTPATRLTPPLHLFSPPPKKNEFTIQDHINLSIDEHKRYFPSESTIGHAFIYQNQNNFTALQYPFIGDNSTLAATTSPMHRLKQICLIKQNSINLPIALAENGYIMLGRRFVDIQLTSNDTTNCQGKLWFFAPMKSVRQVAFMQNQSIENTKYLNFFLDKKFFKNRNVLATNSPHEKLNTVLENIATVEVIKKGEIKLDPQSVAMRGNEIREVSQNDVMSNSAINEFFEFYQRYKDIIADNYKPIFERAERARPYYRGSSLKSQFRPEWLHLIGYRLTPTNYEPQSPYNLAAAAKWVNTKMMTTEGAVKWFQLNSVTDCCLSGEFNILYPSQICKFGHIKANIITNNNIITISQNLYPFEPNPEFSRTTDVRQTTFFAYSWLNGISGIHDEVGFITNKEIDHYCKKAAELNNPGRQIMLSLPKENLLKANLPILFKYNAQQPQQKPAATCAIDNKNNNSGYSVIKFVTTGLTNVDRILEIAAINLDLTHGSTYNSNLASPSLVASDIFHQLCLPDLKFTIPESIASKHSLCAELLKNEGSSTEQSMVNLKKFIGSRTLVWHYQPVIQNMLMAEMKLAKLNFTFDQFIDTVQLCKELLPKQKSYSLPTLTYSLSLDNNQLPGFEALFIKMYLGMSTQQQQRFDKICDNKPSSITDHDSYYKHRCNHPLVAAQQNALLFAKLYSLQNTPICQNVDKLAVASTEIRL